MLQSGFTLVELLVALSVLAVVMGALAGSMSVSSRLARTVTERSPGLDRFLQVRQFLGRQLRQASGEAVLLPDGTRRIPFQGEARQLSFVASMPEASTSSGLHRMTLAIEQGKVGESLILLYEPFLPGFAAPARLDEPGREVLLEHLVAAAFSYRGAEAGSWTDYWDTPDELPALVRISYTSPDEGRSSDLLVAPRVDSRYAIDPTGAGIRR